MERSRWFRHSGEPALLDKFDHDARLDHTGQFFDVPVGQPNTSMRSDLADQLRFWRAVNAIASVSQGRPIGSRVSSSTTKISAFV